MLHVSHIIWETRAVFEAWTKSGAFRGAHSRATVPHTLTTELVMPGLRELSGRRKPEDARRALTRTKWG
jgi:hypothetical protein